jgi:hypothetical protein
MGTVGGGIRVVLATRTEGEAFVFFDDRCPADVFEEITTGAPIPPTEYASMRSGSRVRA